ncbi:MAG: hypothetical protein QM784_04355, partial [Polyangiaceae bacterium]
MTATAAFGTESDVRARFRTTSLIPRYRWFPVRKGIGHDVNRNERRRTGAGDHHAVATVRPRAGLGITVKLGSTQVLFGFYRVLLTLAI